MAAILREADDIAGGEPGQLIRQLIPLERRQIHRDREAGRSEARRRSGEPAQLVEIDNHFFADARLDRREQQDVARRHLDCLTGIFGLRFQHVSAKQHDRDALKSTTFNLIDKGLQWECHGRHLSSGNTLLRKDSSERGLTTPYIQN